ncbi:MAG: transglutaminase family protein [Ilumatobacteraceae bacterium]
MIESSPVVRFSIQHRTEYRYGLPMSDGYTVAHLLPRDTAHQRVVSAHVEVEPVADEYEEHIDLFGNRVVRIGIHHRHDALTVVGHCVVDVDVVPDDGGLPVSSPAWEDVAAAVAGARGDLAAEVAPFAAVTEATPALPALDHLVGDLFWPGRPILDVVAAVSSRIYGEFVFDAEFSDVSTPIAAVIAARRGVCQDFAHLMLACLRSRGLAARYVSGYIETFPAPGEVKLTGTDASHAWCSVWSPGIGWLDADPTNDQVPPRRHITVGWGRDYADVPPVRGVVIGPSSWQTLDVGVDVAAV